MTITGKSLIAVLDVGTSVLKTSLIAANGEFIASRSCIWTYEPAGFRGALAFDPETLLARFGAMFKNIPENDGLLFNDIAAIIVSSQRLGFILLDNCGNPVYGIPNIDRRAVDTALKFQSDEYAEYYNITGRWPGAQHMLSRLLWFRNHLSGSDGYLGVSKILSISDWITFALTGVMCSERTTACETCCYDIRTNDWSSEILYQENLSRSLFCDLVKPGQVVGKTIGKAARELGLPEGIPVCLGGGDTQFGVLGSGAFKTGDTAVVAGSSAPVNHVVCSPLADRAFRTVTNPYLIDNMWVLEANAMLTGLSFSWAGDLLFPYVGAQKYSMLEKAAKEYMTGTSIPEQIFTFAGPSIADSRHGNMYSEGMISFAMSDFTANRITREAFSASIYESAAFAITANIRVIEEIAAMDAVREVTVGGGESKSQLLLDILLHVSRKHLSAAHAQDITSLGAAIQACFSLGYYNSLEEACNAMVKKHDILPIQWQADMTYYANISERCKKWIEKFKEYKEKKG